MAGILFVDLGSPYPIPAATLEAFQASMTNLLTLYNALRSETGAAFTPDQAAAAICCGLEQAKQALQLYALRDGIGTAAGLPKQ